MDLEKTARPSDSLDEETWGQSWLLEKIIPEFQTTVIFGDEDAYKTFVAISLAFQIQNGLKDLGETKKTGVLYLCLENHHGFLPRIEAINQLHENLEPIFVDKDKFNICHEEDVVHVAKYCKRNGFGFLVIDTLSQAIHDGDESSASVGRSVRNACTVFNQNQISVLLVHHTGKNGSAGARGSTIITYDAPSRLKIRRLKGDKGYLYQDKSKSDNKGNKIHFTMIPEGNSLNVVWNKDAETKLTREILNELEADIVSVPELYEILKSAYQDIKPESFRKKLDREIEKLVGQGILDVVRRNKVKYIKRTDSNDEEEDSV